MSQGIKTSTGDVSSTDSSHHLGDIKGFATEEPERTETRHHPTDTADGSDEGGYEPGKEAPLGLHKSYTHTLGVLKLRARDDSDPIEWWFASTAIPLIAATLAPMANMLSIAALVVFWRNDVMTDDPLTRFSTSVGVADPKWCFNLNAASLACGFVGNLFLLFNFTQRVRYIVALPVTIFFFYLASGILIGIIVAMDRYEPPGPNQVYSQGYWHAVIAACLYVINSMVLMVNMLGYFLGHYPQHFTLNEEQRNLILQTMLFFLWLAGGAGVFARVQGWDYPDALYFCDVTILTIGFGDFYATNDTARGLVFPFSVGGTIILGLMVSSLHKFARELSKEKVLRKHVETRRVNTLERAVTMDTIDEKNLSLLAGGKSPNISRPSERDAQNVQRSLHELAREEQERRGILTLPEAAKDKKVDVGSSPTLSEPRSSQFLFHGGSRLKSGTFSKSVRSLTLPLTRPVSTTASNIRRVMTKNQKSVLMLEERDRFNAMRDIQTDASQFKKYYALGVSIVCFGMLWCLGAMVFYFAEATTQKLNYFQTLYFGYVSLLTIGYGDLSPKSNAGKAFFVVWSLIAVPTMTILISDLGDTVIGGFKRGVLHNDLGLTSEGDPSGSFGRLLRRLWRAQHPVPGQEEARSTSPAPSTVEDGSLQRASTPVEPIDDSPKTIDQLANDDFTDANMMRRLAFAVRRTADDLTRHPDKRYSYEEWVEFTRLIKWSKLTPENCKDIPLVLENDEAMDGVVEWDWLDENSPMASDQSESEWVLDRLCESLLRSFQRSDFQLGGIALMPPQPRAQASIEGKAIPMTPVTPPRQSKDGSTSPRDFASRSLSPMAVPEHSDGPGGDPSESGIATHSPGAAGMRQLFYGDQDHNGEPRWSKRGKAKLVTIDSDAATTSPRRRSSTRGKGTSSGPLARYGLRWPGHASRKHEPVRTLNARLLLGNDTKARQASVGEQTTPQ